MSQNSAQNRSEHCPSFPDFSTLASELHEVTQIVLSRYSQVPQAQGQSEQHLEAVPSPPASAETIQGSVSQEPSEAPTKDQPPVFPKKEETSSLKARKATGLPTDLSQKKGTGVNRKVLKTLFKAFCFGPARFTAFVDKTIAKEFDRKYNSGNFKDEIHYYYVPAHVVEFEYKLLALHQQKDIPSLLAGVCNDLNLKSQLLAYISKDPDLHPDLCLSQLSGSILQSLKLLHTIDEHMNSLRLVHKTTMSPDSYATAVASRQTNTSLANLPGHVI